MVPVTSALLCPGKSSHSREVVARPRRGSIKREAIAAAARGGLPGIIGTRMKRQFAKYCSRRRRAGALLLFGAGASQAAEGKLKVAFFGFELNQHLARAGPAKASGAGFALIGAVFAKMLADSGRYEIAPLPEALRRKIAQSAGNHRLQWLRDRMGARGRRRYRRLRHGAEVSNLILNETSI